MRTVSSYFNPCSSEFNIARDFKSLSLGQRVGVVLLTALAALCSLGILALPVCRILVCTPLNTKNLPQPASHTHAVATKTLNAVTTKPAEQLIAPPVTQKAPIDPPQPTITPPPPVAPLSQVIPPIIPQQTIAPIVTPPSSPTITPSTPIVIPTPIQPNLLTIEPQTLPPPVSPATCCMATVSPPTPPPSPPSPTPTKTPSPPSTPPLKPSQSPSSGSFMHIVGDTVVFGDNGISISGGNASVTFGTHSPLEKSKEIFFETIHYATRFRYKFPDLSAITQVKRALIKERLKATGQVAGDAIDNADCFIHAFCQALKGIKHSEYASVDTVRGDFAFLLMDARYPAFNKPNKWQWLKDWFVKNQKNLQETFEEYTDKAWVSGSGRDVSKKGPYWGYAQREGRILCEKFNVNLKVYRADITGLVESKAKTLLKDPKALKAFLAEKQCVFQLDQNKCVTVPGATETIELVTYQQPNKPNFYLPVFDATKVPS